MSGADGDVRHSRRYAPFAFLASGDADRAGHEGLDLGARTAVPRVWFRHLHACARRGSGAGSGQCGRMAGGPRRRARPPAPVRRRLVGARVRLSRARRLPSVRRAARADARAGRPAIPELGPGRRRPSSRATTVSRRRRWRTSSSPPRSTSRRGSRPCRTASGSAPAGAATAPASPSRRSPRYFVHDPIHHLHDVHQGFDALSA